MAERAFATIKAPEARQTCSNSCKQNVGFNSSVSTADRILQLQRIAGNQAVQRLIKSRDLQAKLRIGQPNDAYEQEADRVAAQVMRIPDSIIRRKCAKCNKDKKIILQAKESVQVPANKGQDVPSVVHQVISSPGQLLDPTTRAFMEPRFGHDFSQVRVHTGTQAAESARAVNALAYTIGKNVVFGTGQYSPDTGAGRHLIAHELTHVVQQRGNQKAPAILHVRRADDTLEAIAGYHAEARNTDYANVSLIHSGSQVGLQRASGAAIAGVAAGGLLTGFGAAFGIDYFSMTRERAMRYAKELDTLYPGWLSSLPKCPCKRPEYDKANWEIDPNKNLSKYHPGAIYSYRSTAAATGGSRHGQQCTYDAAENLLTGGAGAGTPDVYSPSWGYTNLPYHLVYDVKTWKELGWETYTKYWKPDNRNNCPINKR